MVSVIIPSYNRADVILRSVNSVLNQSYRDIEVIVVDDCSSDNTQQLLKQIEDPRLRYIKHEKNKGACAARNTGIHMSRGEYIAFHDSDDVCRINRIEHELNALINYNSDVVFCALERNYANNTIFPNMEEGFKSFEDILYGLYVSTQTILGKKSVFEQFQFDEKVKRMQDYDLMIRVSNEKKVYFLNEVLVDVYIQNNSLTKNEKNYYKEEEMLRNLLNKYPEYANEYPKWKVIILKMMIRSIVMQNKNPEKELNEIIEKSPTKRNKIIKFANQIHLLKFVYTYIIRK